MEKFLTKTLHQVQYVEIKRQAADASTLTRLHFLGEHLSAHQDGAGIPATVGLVDHPDLHRVVHQEVLDGDGPGLSLQGVGVFPLGKEAQHLQERRS